MPGRIRLGTQGWNYDAWVGPFYPEGTRPGEFLRTYARAFDTVEVDSTFYAVPAAKTVKGWAERTPDGFTFALKMNTSGRRLEKEGVFRTAGTYTLNFFWVTFRGKPATKEYTDIRPD